MNKKHLTLDDRATIKAMLDSCAFFKEIARTLQVHCTTISKEVRARFIFKKSGCFGHAFNDCKHRFNCTLSKLCDPSSPYQKGVIENNHEFIRRILPKGESLDMVTAEQVVLMMNHVNSYKRSNLGNKSPYEVFRLFYGQEVLDLLGASLIPPNEIILSPKLLK